MHRRLLPLALCVVLLGALSLPTASAQSGGVARLSLAECRTMALANNLDLVAARKDPAIAEQQIEQNEAPFDGAISAGVTYNDSDGDEDIADNVVPANTGTGANESDSTVYDVSLSHLLKWGGSYSLTYDMSEVDASSTSVQPSTGFLTTSQFIQDRDGFTLDYSMPLLKGFGKEVNTVNLMLSEGNLDISREDLRLLALQTIQSVEDAYWDTLAAREALRISRLALERAESLLELNRKKVEVGTLAPIEITEAEAGVASQVEQVIIAETNLESAEDILLQLLAVPEDDPMWDQSLDPTDRPSYAPVKIDLADAIATALAERPEMATARQRLKNDELSERVARRNKRHGLDLTASISPDAQTETDQRIATLQPPGIPPSDTTTDGEKTDWSVGLRYTYSLRNRAAKADYAIARIQADRSGVSLQNSELSVRVDVRRSVRNVQSGSQRVEAARKNVELQKEKLEAEQKKFDNGMTTSFEVLTFQNDLADAELAEIRARTDYVKSLTALERSKGTLLDARGLKLGS